MPLLEEKKLNNQNELNRPRTHCSEQIQCVARHLSSRTAATGLSPPKCFYAQEKFALNIR